MAKPTIVFVPGLWEGPTVFSQVANILSSHNYPTQAVSLASTGTRSPNNPSMKDDETVIRSVVQKLVEEEEEKVVLVMHSAGGFLGSGAIEGLDQVERKGKGMGGGVITLVFLAAGVAEVGYQHVDLPFMDSKVSCYLFR